MIMFFDIFLGYDGVPVEAMQALDINGEGHYGHHGKYIFWMFFFPWKWNVDDFVNHLKNNFF